MSTVSAPRIAALKQAGLYVSDARRAYGKLAVTLRRPTLLEFYRQRRYLKLVAAYLLKRYDQLVGGPDARRLAAFSKAAAKGARRRGRSR